jgi:outer membrane protein OmpU
MNNLKKIGLTAIAASLATVSANAADFSVSGGASMSYTSNAIVGIGGGANGNPWAMSDTVNFAASGELDNGWTISYTLGLDGSVAPTSGFEDRTLAIGLGDMGTITMMGQDGSSVVGSLEASYVPSTGVAAGGSTDIGITYSGIDGLTIGVATGTDDTVGAGSEVDEQAMYITYAYDAFTFGVQSNESDSAVAGADSEFSGWAVSYAVSDDISVSLAQTEIEREGDSANIDATTEHTAISASYTMGSMAVKATRADVSNAQGNEARDGEAYAVELSFAF